MSIEDRDWYREHMKAKSSPVAAAAKPLAKRRNHSAPRYSKLYWTLIFLMIAAAIISELT